MREKNFMAFARSIVSIKMQILLLVMSTVVFLTGCGLSPERKMKVAQFKAEREQIAPAEIPKMLDVLVSQCARILQNKSLEKEKLKEAGFKEKTNLLGAKIFIPENKTGKHTNKVVDAIFFPKGLYGDCQFTISYYHEGISVIRAISEATLQKNGFVLLPKESSLLKQSPRYSIGNAKTRIARVINISNFGVTFTFSKD